MPDNWGAFAAWVAKGAEGTVVSIDGKSWIHCRSLILIDYQRGTGRLRILTCCVCVKVKALEVKCSMFARSG